MGALLSNNNGVLRLKSLRRKRNPSSLSTLATLSATLNPSVTLGHQSAALDDQSVTSDCQASQQSASFDTRKLPYATLKSENDRMNANQFAIKSLFGGNYIQSLDEHIDFDRPDTKVLDVGCGAGGWIMDMATEHPEAQFTGVDKVSLFPQEIRPVNVKFEKCDVTLGLPFKDNTFDFVQMRLFLIAFNKIEWDECLQEVYRVLKPNGFIQLLEVDMIDDGDDVVKELADRIETMLSDNNQDAFLARKLSTVLSEGGFTNIATDKKSISLKDHELAGEFLFIFGITFDLVKNIVFAAGKVSTEEQYQAYKKQWLKSREESSNSTWYAAVGQKVVTDYYHL